MKPEQVKSFVEENPGITFSELRDELGMENGQLQYHLKKCRVFRKDRGLITRKACENCGLKGECGDRCIVGLLRDIKKKRICRMISEGEKKDIAEELSLHPSTVSYHVSELKDAGIIDNGDLTEEAEKIIESTPQRF